MSLARQIVNFAIQAGSSDIHLEEGSPIAIRVNSDIRILENILGPNEMSSLLSEIVGEEKLEQFKCITAVVDIPELDFYYTAMFVPGEEGNAVWEQMHEGNETIH